MPPSTSSTTPSTTRSQRKRAADDVVMFQGHPLDHDWIVKLFKSGADQKKQSRQAMTMCRDLYRKTLTVGIAQSWALRHPDIAATAIEVLPQRRGYVDNLKASVGSAIPTYERQPLGYLDSDRDAAKECRSYMDEWRERNVPINTFNGKAIEDGQYMVTVLPTDSEIDGRPDFYDTLDEDAWNALSEEEQAKYQKDAHDRRGRYAKFDDKGRKTPHPRWDRNARGQTPDSYAADQKKRADKPSPFERDDAKSTEAHDDAVRRYLLSTDRQATTVRVVSAFDVAPFFQRSTDNKRWDLIAAVERRLVYPEDLEAEYGWKNMGDRALIPTGFDESRTTGQYGQFYLYIAYLVHTTREKGGRRCRRPMLAYTVAGQPTYLVGGEQPQDQTVGLIDLYETHGLEGPRWFYSGGMYSDDDNPDYCWSPALWPFVESILTIESNKTAINCAVGANAFTGYWNKPDSKLVELDPEAMVDADDNLVVPEMPPPGEIATAIGEVFPVASASINQDAWRKYQADLASLDAAMAIDQISSNASTSARSMVVQNTIGMIAKRQVREGNLYSVVRAGNCTWRRWLPFTASSTWRGRSTRPASVRWAPRCARPSTMSSSSLTGSARTTTAS
jgi:hypothetical protein